MSGRWRTMISNNRFLIAGIAAAMVYWVVESVIEVLAFGANSIVEQMFRADVDEMSMRAFAALLMIGGGAYAQRVNARIRRAEGDLREYKHIVSSSTDMLALLDERFNYLAANEAYVKAFGLTLEQLIGNTVAEVFGEEFFNTVIKPHADRCLRGEEVDYQDWFDFPSAGRRYMDITYHPHYREDNKITGFVVTGRDITEPKRMEDELRQSEELHRTTLSNISDAVFITDSAGDFTYVCPNVDVIFGWPTAEVSELGNISRLLGDDLIPPGDLGNLGEMRNLECEIKDSSDERHDLLVNMKPVRIGDGTVLYTCRDVTERRRMEELEMISSKEKDVLLQEIHHRVKNNLQVISSILDMSSLRIQDEQALGLLTDARAKVHTMGLIHSQLYRGERFDRINMNSHIRDLAQYLSSVYKGDKDVEVSVRADDVDLSLTQAVPCALAVSELISNSFKHAFKERHGGSIEITLQGLPGNTIALTVKDDGCGLPDEIDFFQADSLGLKLVRNLVRKQLRGNVQVNRNGGTEFVVTFQREVETNVESPRGR